MSDFPLTLSAFQTNCWGLNGCSNPQAFVLAMNSSGNALLYSTLLGDGSANGIALDSAQNAYVTGVAGSAYFPAISPVQTRAQFGYGDAFVTKLNSAGVPSFSTFLGGTGTADYGNAIALDSNLNIYVAGQTSFASNLFAPDFPVVNPFQASAGCCFADVGFVARLSLANTAALSVSSLQPLVFVRNVSTTSVSISNIAVAGTGGAIFASGGSCGHSITLAPASECFIALQQTSGAIPVAANITITSNASSTSQVFTAFPASTGAPVLLYSPNTLEFGPQLAGTTSPTQKITVYNTSLQTVSIGNIQMTGADFSLTHNCPSSLASGASCAITVRFAPTGSNSGGNINVNYGNGFKDSLYVTGITSPGSLYVNSQGYNFGTQYVGTAGMSRVVNLTNATSSTVTINNISLSGPYSKTTSCGASLAPQSSCRVAVVFSPTGNGPGNGSLTANFSGAGSPASVSFVGIGKINADLSVSPLTMDFGSALVGYSGNGGQLTLTNTSSTGLTISSLTFSDPQFSQTNNCPVPPSLLAASSSCTVNITFAPTSVGPQSGTLTIQNSGAGAAQVISLTGTGTTPIIFMPASLTFSSQAIGTSSPQTYIDVANNSGQPFTIQSIAVHGDFQIVQNPCPTPGQQLAPFWGCALQIVFTPTKAGTINGDVTVMASDEPFAHVASLTGTGIGPLTSLSTASLTFGSQPTGSSSAAQTITLSNTGNATLHITNVVTSSGFAETNTCASSVLASTSCTISVTFAPTTTGSVTGSLTITDDAGGSPQAVTLSGSGTDYSLGLSSGSSSATVSAGQSASYNLQLTPMAGFTGTVNITCAGAPPAATCSASPGSLNVSTAAVPFTVRLSTSAPSAAFNSKQPHSPAFIALALLPCGMPLFFAAVPARQKRRRRYYLALGLLLTVLTATGCGGGGGTQSSGSAGTPKGTYNLVVKASAGTASRTTTLSLTVQ